MAGAVGNYSDGETIHGGDLNADLTSLLGNDAQLFLDIFAGWNILVSGFALTAGSGMAVNVAAGLAYANGIRLNMTSGSVTLATGNTQPRTDVIWVQAGTTAGTNGTTGNPTKTDSGTFGVQAGTPGGGVPALGDQTKVQIGTVSVPANASTASACTLNSQATAPNAQGPVKTLVDLLTHIAASHATSVVHGFQATTAGGTGTNELAATDGTYGAVGRALALVDNGGTARQASQPGANAPNLIATADGSSRVYDSNRLQGVQLGTGNGNIPQLDANGAVAKAEQVIVSGSPVAIFQGQGTFLGTGNDLTTAVSFGHTFASPPVVEAWLLWDKTGSSPPLWTICSVGVQNGSITTTGFTLGATGGNNGHTFTYQWRATGA